MSHSALFVIASHDCHFLGRVCGRGIVFYHGRILFDGPICGRHRVLYPGGHLGTPMNVPLLSVVIPVFNVKAYLPELFASLQETRRRDVEIILVDDAGQDGSWTWIEDWGIPLLEGFFVKCIRHERNLGLSAARNSGLGAATGRYVLFLDSDDVLEAGALDVIATEIESSAKDLYFLDFDFLSTEHCTFRRPLRARGYP